MNISPGAPHPLGASLDPDGVNFAVYSEHASGIDLCLFAETGEEAPVALPERTGDVWHGYVPGLKAGQRYGFRAKGLYEPTQGLRFNPNVVLVDPYARALDGVESWGAGCFAYDLGSPSGDLRMATSPALGAPRAVVVDPAFDWEGDTPLGIPLHHSFIYEAHVRGLTKLHPELPEALRGTVETSWTRPNQDYDGALRAFVEGMTSDDGFMLDVAAFCARLAPHGATNALAQTLLKLCAPGVPDTYQGSELWNQSLVDPDNRQPVDFDRRRTLLAQIEAGAHDPGQLARDRLARWADGGVKLLVVRAALRVRAQLKELFRRGDYVPLSSGEHVAAFARTFGDHTVVAIAPRFSFTLTRGDAPWALGEVWGEQRLALPQGGFRDVLSDRAHHAGSGTRMADLLADFPVALLVNVTSEGDSHGKHGE